MPKRRPPIEETLAAELYDYFLIFIQEKKTIPIERAFWGWLIRRNYYTSQQLSENLFRYHFDRLREEGWIMLEPDTRALIPRRNVKIDVDR